MALIFPPYGELISAPDDRWSEDGAANFIDDFVYGTILASPPDYLCSQGGQPSPKVSSLWGRCSIFRCLYYTSKSNPVKSKECVGVSQKLGKFWSERIKEGTRMGRIIRINTAKTKVKISGNPFNPCHPCATAQPHCRLLQWPCAAAQPRCGSLFRQALPTPCELLA